MLQVGVLLQNRYRILRELGGGGMGTVYLAEDARLPGRQCAIKQLSPAQVPAEDRNWAIQYFQQEAQLLARLYHPGLTRVTDYFPEKGCWYLVMDFIAGETLEQHLARLGKLPLEESLSIIIQICDVLEFLHRQTPAIIFRDLKPSNIMLTPDGQVKLIDFGIARFFNPGKTRDTVNLGTPGYAAPEQFGGMGQSDPRTDVYSLGVLLHQLLTELDPTEMPLGMPLAPLSRAFPKHIETAIRQATQLDPAQRFSSAFTFRQALVGASDAPVYTPPRSSKIGKSIFYISGALVMCVLVACFGVWGMRAWLEGPGETAIPVITLSPSPEARVIETETPAPVLPPTEIATDTPTELPTVPPLPPLTPLPVDLVRIPATTFLAGASEADIDFAANLCAEYEIRDCRTPFEDELPRSLVNDPADDVYYLQSREMTLAAFYIDRYEVTFAEYRVCVEAGVCNRPVSTGRNPRRLYYGNPAYDNYPVIYVTWQDADTFCRWRGARLPTAWEWELAARGTDGRRFPWGNTLTANRANYRTPQGTPAAEEDTVLQGGNIRPVGSYPDDRSPYGVMDMAGNVMEWVAGWYGVNMREIRGGSWNTSSHTLRTTSRVRTDPRYPNQAYFDIGFRCAQDSQP